MSMSKVCKFGGSSLADANQYRKIKAIIESDPNHNDVAKVRRDYRPEPRQCKGPSAQNTQKTIPDD